MTMLLHVSAFVLAVGAGLHLGFSFFRQEGPFVGAAWFRLPRPALVDVAWIYVLIVPLFAIGSVWDGLFPGA
jgi:hypothetical protein